VKKGIIEEDNLWDGDDPYKYQEFRLNVITCYNQEEDNSKCATQEDFNTKLTDIYIDYIVLSQQSTVSKLETDDYKNFNLFTHPTRYWFG